jgi:nucleotide-binding universal stress UspA family protein
LKGSPILVGVDDSEASREAAALGFRVAHAADAPLHLITATLDALSEVAAARPGLDPRPLEQAREGQGLAAVRARLRGSVPDEVLDRALTARTGRPERVLVDAARELQAASIVIGGRSRRGLAPWFHRGTAHHLLRRLDLPILVSGPRSARIARVLVAVDLSFAAAIAISAAEEIASLLDLPLEALHVIDDSLYAARPPLPIDRDRFVDGTIERLETEIWPLLATGRQRSNPIGSVVEIVSDTVRRGPAPLLVLGTHGSGRVDRLLLGSTTEKLLARLPASLLIVPTVPPDGEVAPGSAAGLHAK